MALESGTFVSDLVSTNPTATDPVREGDDHLRLIKTVLKNTFPNAGVYGGLSNSSDTALGATLIGYNYGGTGGTGRTLRNKLMENVTPFDKGAIGDGVTDDTVAVQRAIDAAWAIAGTDGRMVEVDLCGYTFGIGARIYGKDGVVVKNGKFIAIGAAWTITDPLFTQSTTEGGGLFNVTIDCQWKCAGVLRSTAKRSSILNSRIYRFKTYGVKDTGTTQESRVSHTHIKQYLFGDTGFDTIVNRDATCLWVDTADSLYDNVVTAYGGIPILVTGPLNLFVNCHAYNGAATDSGESLAIKVEGASANNNVFTNIYADNGIIQLNDNFRQTFVGVQFQRNASGTNTKAFELLTSSASSDGGGFSVTDARFNGTFAAGFLVYSVSGAGSWVTNKKVSIHGIRSNTGTVSGTAPLAQWLDECTLDSGGRFITGHTVSVNIGSVQSRGQFIGSGVAGGISILNYGNDATPALLNLCKSRGGAVNTFAALQSADVVGRLAFVGDDGSSGNYAATGARIEAVTNGGWTGASRPTRLIFSTVNTGENTPTQRVEVTSGGHFAPMVTNTYDLGVNGGAAWRNIYSQNAVTVVSDGRTKDQIVSSQLGLDFVRKLQPVSYLHKIGGYVHSDIELEPAIYDEKGELVKDAVVERRIDAVAGKRRHFGFVAQDVKRVLDELGIDFAGWVKADPNDPNSLEMLRPGEFIAPLAKAVQELDKLREAQDVAIAKLEARLAKLEAKA